jgi:hypothetical protein
MSTRDEMQRELRDIAKLAATMPTRPLANESDAFGSLESHVSLGNPYSSPYSAGSAPPTVPCLPPSMGSVSSIALDDGYSSPELAVAPSHVAMAEEFHAAFRRPIALTHDATRWGVYIVIGFGVAMAAGLILGRWMAEPTVHSGAHDDAPAELQGNHVDVGRAPPRAETAREPVAASPSWTAALVAAPTSTPPTPSDRSGVVRAPRRVMMAPAVSPTTHPVRLPGPSGPGRSPATEPPTPAATAQDSLAEAMRKAVAEPPKR